jgi:hypothetical protein
MTMTAETLTWEQDIHDRPLTDAEKIQALKEALRAALDWIDAVPADVVSRLPAMPGICRDEVEMLLED